MATRDRKCNLIVDSCIDLPAELVQSFDVAVMPFTYTMDDGVYADDLWTSISPHAFYNRMRKGERPTTSQVPIGRIQEFLGQAAETGVPTVFICFTGGLSGTFESIVKTWDGMKGDYPNFEMHIVDSKLASGAIGMLVMEAVRQCDRGLSAQELADWAREARYYIHAYFTLDGLESLRRGGRIPDMAAVVGAKLDIKPIVTFDLDGRLTFFGATRGRKKAIKQLFSIFENRYDGNLQRDVLVGSGDSPKDQNALTAMILKEHTEISIGQISIGPVIGSHTGPDMLAIGFWGPDRRESMPLSDRIAKAVSGLKRDGGQAKKASADQDI